MSDAAFFDVDGTVVCTNTMIDFHRHYHRAAPAGATTAARLARRARGLFALGRYGALSLRRDDRRSVNVAYMLDYAGRAVAEYGALVPRWFEARVRPYLNEAVVARLRRHQEDRRPVVLVTGSPEILVRPLADLLAVDELIATRLEVVDGRFTGRMLDASPLVGDGKAEAVWQFARRHGIDLAESYAYGDHVSDFAMLAIVGRSTLIARSPRWQREAARWGFAVLSPPSRRSAP